jgi:hypothetical protein
MQYALDAGLLHSLNAFRIVVDVDALRRVQLEPLKDQIKAFSPFGRQTYPPLNEAGSVSGIHL